MFCLPTIFRSFLFALISLTAFTYGDDSHLVSLKGYLGKDEIAKAQTQSEQIKDTILIEINSTSGDLLPVLDFAKRLYERKIQEQNLKITVYINDNALGPAAALPFVADQIETSVFVSWGDIPLGSDNILPANILKNRVISIIPASNPNAPLLRLMASAMSDPAFTSDQWKNFPAIGGGNGSTLVVNHNQLKELNLVSQVIPSDAFKNRYTPQLEKASDKAQQTNLAPSTLNEKLKAHIHYSLDKKNNVGRIVIDDRTNGINQSTWLYVKNALDYYKKTKPIFIILELNTPGGEVFAAQKISDALKEMDTQSDIPIVAYINNWAISAGAMLAYSSRFITVVSDGSMGAAEPVVTDSTGEMKTASEKVNSALRADFANRAKFFGRNPDIAEKMVDKELILVQRHGKIIRLDSESQIQKSGPDRDIILSSKGKLLTLNAEQLMQYDVADMLIKPTQLPAVTTEEEFKGQWPGIKSPLFHQEFFKEIPQAEIDTYKMDWKTYFLYILSNPVVSSLLFLGLMLGFYAEINHPGLGLPGTVAATCLFLIILSSFALEIGSWLEVILLLTGLAIILFEIFVLPTFGLLGFIGLVFFIAGLFGLMLPGLGEVSFEYDTSTWNAAGEAFIKRLGWLSVTLVAGLVIIGLLARYVMPSFSTFQRFVLTGSEQNGYIAGDDPKLLPQKGSKGEALTALRPSGKIVINDKIYDAMSGGRFIEQGTPVIVSKLDGSVIIVNASGEGIS